MGYTHYWQQPANAYTYDSFNELCGMISEIIATAAKKPWSIGIEMVNLGSGDVICLNGTSLDGSDNEELAHEDLAIERFAAGFNFCKTAQKPYDTVVVASLIAAELIANRNGVSIDLSSDGELTDWADGIKLFETCFPGLLATADVRLAADRLEYVDRSPAKINSIRRGQLRVWWVNQSKSDNTFYHNVESVVEGKRILEALMAYDKFLSESRLHCMGVGFQEFVGDDDDADNASENYGWISVAQ